jgi:3-oxoacyl-[acyl-carrier protein] reductase
MDLELKDRVALVVGAAGSMGEALVARLLGEQALVVAADLPGKLESPAYLEPERTGRLRRVAIDVTSQTSVAQAAQDAAAWRGRLDICVVLAGIYHAKPVLEITPEEWSRILDVNLKGSFLVSQAALGVMQRGSYGRLILLASLAGQVGGVVAGAHYAASKAGVLSLVKSLAKQVKEPFITINAISPGPIAGAMTDAWPQADKDRMIANIPLGRFGTPEEIADLALFLASPRAAFIKGARVDINGGAHMD